MAAARGWFPIAASASPHVVFEKVMVNLYVLLRTGYVIVHALAMDMKEEFGHMKEEFGPRALTVLNTQLYGCRKRRTTAAAYSQRNTPPGC